MFRKLDAICAAQCIVASNTPSIDIGLASYLAPHAGRAFSGTHFFSPVSRMKLVEVSGLDTSDETVEITMQACREAGKTPIK